MNRLARRWAAVAVLAFLARHRRRVRRRPTTGRSSFYDQHPEYRNDPTYMHPSDPDDTSNDNKRF